MIKSIFFKRKIITYLVSIFILSFFLGASDAQATITSKEDWDAAFTSKYGDETDLDKLLVQNGFYNDTKARFAWHGNYWVRAFVTMAETFSDLGYLDEAVNLIDYMLYYRDDARAARGEIDILEEPYHTAPLFYLNNRDQVMPGWRRIMSDGTRRILTLDDGQITNAIMRFVHLVYDDPEYAAFQAKAEEYLTRVMETVDAHTESYIFDRQPRVPGSYYNPQTDGSRVSWTPIPYNQSAAMGITLVLLDEVLDGAPEYRAMAEGIVAYWRNYARLEPDNSYVWDYAPFNGSTCSANYCKVEDIGHGHIDVGFLLLAYNYSIGGLNVDDVVHLTNTWVQNVYLGNGQLAVRVDGSGLSNETWNAGFDWIDLAEFDPSVLDIAIEVYESQHSTPGWGRPFLGWAEILRWTHIPNSEPTLEPDPEPEPVDPEPQPVDTEVPQVDIISPANGDVIGVPGPLEIHVNAVDNVAVSRVEIYLNDALRVTMLGSGPYYYVTHLPGKRNQVYEITAKAFDQKGNTRSAHVSVDTARRKKKR